MLFTGTSAVITSISHSLGDRPLCEVGLHSLQR